MREAASRSLEELGGVMNALSSSEIEGMERELLGAGRIALYGVGREGLVMRALAMRLYHLGVDAHVVGDMSCPPLGRGDLLAVSAGPGAFSTVIALMRTARGAGARTAVFTAQPSGEAPGMADRVLTVPAQTMATDTAEGGAERASVLPMGSLYEIALWLTADLLVRDLQERRGTGYQAMRARHTNLE